MRIPSPVVLLLVAVAGCAPPPDPPPAAVAATAPVAPPPEPAPEALPPVPGHAGPLEPITGPVELRYAPAAFRMTVTVSVSDAPGTPPSTLTARVEGRIAGTGPTLQATLVTAEPEIDGRPAGAGRRLVQDIAMTPKGALLDLQARMEDGAPVPDAMRPLEARWRERLPEFRPGPVAAGDDLFLGNDPLAPLRQMLRDQAYGLTVGQPFRLVARGETPCGSGRCLVAERQGAAVLESPGRRLDVTLAGHALVDLATGLVVDALDTVELTDPKAAAGAGRLTMTVRTATELRKAEGGA